MAHVALGAAAAPHTITAEERKVIFASSVGTVFEWYDFYLYATLVAIISKQFFSGVNETAAFIFALLAFAAGFAVRPFGAVFFGRIGDLVGRKYTFLVTILMMGASTFVVGLLPNYATAGIIAPIVLILLRLLQGLALGGEYGGAATYVAEHAPPGRRGFFTSWIQTTATLGLFLSLIVILVTRTLIGEAAFADWGWRIPFLVSALLLAISVWIRLTLSESPAFQRMKAEGRGSTSPVKESFGEWRNLRLVLLALFGLTAGQAVVWYTGQFYALIFLTQTLKVDPFTANIMVVVALGLGVPFFVVFGWLSDRIGRKPIIMLGCLLPILTYFPLFHALTQAANPALAAAIASAPVSVTADPASCSFQFNPIGTAKFTTSCDIAKSFLAKNSVNYTNVAAPAGTVASVKIGGSDIPGYEGTGLPPDQAKASGAAFETALFAALKTAGYPVATKTSEKDGVVTQTYAMAPADLNAMNKPMVIAILFVLVLYVTLVYGPIAAMLVEMFPTRIRYTSMSLPYHLGNGWFGGFLPTTVVAMVAATGDIYYGLWYPIVVAAVTLVIGVLFVRETRGTDVDATG